MPTDRDTHRRPNGQGGIRAVQRAEGELRYRATLRGKHLGVFDRRADAEAAIKRALEEQERRN